MDEQVEVKDYVNIDPNEAYADTASTWDNVLQQHRDAGYTDSQIINKFDNSNWTNGAKYNEWRSKVNAQDEANAISNIEPTLGMNMDKAQSAFNTDNTLFKPNLNVEEGKADFSDVDSNYVKPTQEELDPVKKELRAKYATDNATFKKMAQEEGIEFAAKSAMKTPMQAYLNGDISKSERDYLIFDAISTAMSNAGNTLLNIAAAYTGGSGNFDTNQKSMWANRMAGVNDANTSALQRGVEGSTQEMEKKLSEQDLRAKGNENRKVEYQLYPAEQLAELAKTTDNPIVKGLSLSMTANLAGNDQDLTDTIATTIATAWPEIEKAAKAENMSPYEYAAKSLNMAGGNFTAASVQSLLGGFNGSGDHLSKAEADVNEDVIKAQKAALANGSITLGQMGLKKSLPKVYGMIDERTKKILGIKSEKDIRNDLLSLGKDMTPEAVAEMYRSQAEQAYNNMTDQQKALIDDTSSNWWK